MTLVGVPPSRLASLDLLRGVAILGILPMNILSFGLVMAAYQNPMALGPLEGGERIAWLVTHLLFDQRFISIFSVMFGAGLALLADRPSRPGDSPTRRHYRRMAWLLAFGMVHAYGIWFGDVLACYAAVAMAVWPLRRLASPWLLAIAAGLLAVPPLFSVAMDLLLRLVPEAERAEALADWAPTAAMIAAEEAVYRGSWMTQLPERALTAVLMQTWVFLAWALWRTAALMLVGIVLLRSGFLAAAWRPSAYAALAAAGFAGGTLLTAWGVGRNEAIGYAAIDAMTIGTIPNYFGSLLGAMGWASLVMLLAAAARPAWLLRPLEAVGRTSLSNYLLQSILCTTLFYGHGLGWFGRLDRVELWAVVVAVWAVQVSLTLLWLRVAAIGPFEWLWRSLASWRRLPLRRRSDRPAAA